MIKRVQLKELISHLSNEEVSLIIGPRQAGKTTLMLLLKEYLEKRGDRTLFLNLDIEADRRFFTSQDMLVRKIELELGTNKGYVFIDEIQRKEDAGLFLKGIYDMNLSCKLIVSGSGSVELKEKIHESLAGRKRVFELGTLTFEELVRFRTDYKYEGKLQDFFAVEKAKTRGFLTEYLSLGGYPRIVLGDTLDEKRKLIDEIYQSYLERDISNLLGVKKTDAFSSLVRLMAAQIGQLITFSELSSTLGISTPTVKDYLWYLEKTFVLHRVTPYFTNLRKEITKSPVYYFYDCGLRNHAVGLFGSVPISRDVGFVFQNHVFNILKDQLRETAATIHFWRTKDRAEVDFVVNTGNGVLPIEVKYRELRKPEMTRSFRTFIEKYNPKKALVVNLELDRELRVGNTTVRFLPFWGLSTELP
jgi:predicted AAA+ superfamily ATPase